MKKPKLSEDKILRIRAEGPGEGKAVSYVPWVKVADSSRGNRRRVLSPKTGRVHHVLSEVESRQLQLFKSTLDAVVIREQYPLERGDTLSR